MNIQEIIKSPKMRLEKQVVMNLMYTAHIVGDAVSEVMKRHDLSPEQFNVLRILRGQKGKPANMHDIQERMIARTSNTTRLVDKLLLKGLVNREICPDNRRKIEITITKEGLELLKELDSKVEAAETSFAKNLSIEELQQLNCLIEKYRTVK